MTDWARRLGLAAVEVHASLPSTNDRAKAWAREGAAPPSLVLSRVQTAGRGRAGRSWASPEGGIWLSLIVESHSPEVDRLLPLRTGLSVARRLEAAGAPPLRLKWPNDLLIREGKVGGVLCETVAGEHAGVVVGVGVNRHPPEVDTGYPTAGIGPLEPEAVVEAVVQGILDAVAVGSPALHPPELERWRRRDHLRDRRVEVEGVGRGTARGLDAAGHLLLESDEGLRPVTAGSVRRLDDDTDSEEE